MKEIELNSKMSLDCSDVKTYNIYPSALSDEELYGEYLPSFSPLICHYIYNNEVDSKRYDPTLQSWTEGLVLTLLKQIYQQHNEENFKSNTGSDGSNDQVSLTGSNAVTRHWMVFDGPLQGSWLPPLYHVSATVPSYSVCTNDYV